MGGLLGWEWRWDKRLLISLVPSSGPGVAGVMGGAEGVKVGWLDTVTFKKRSVLTLLTLLLVRATVGLVKESSSTAQSR